MSPDEQCREHGCARWRCDINHAPERCGCDESLALTKRLDLALEALDAIKGVLLNTPLVCDATKVSFIGSIVSLAGANLERVKL